MKGFIYDGKSTDSILDSSSLGLCTFESIDTIVGTSRENISGDISILRSIANEYGTTSTPLTFDYALYKTNEEAFTDEEQIIIETWLTSPQFSKDLQIFDCNTKEITDTFCGKFLSTEWIPLPKGWAGIKFTFQNNSAYAKKHYDYSYTINNIKETTFLLNCESNELEKYIYPNLIIKKKEETGTISIQNVNDNKNEMTIRAYKELPMYFDCLHCIPKDETTNQVISYSDLGWTDVGDIYWFRLLPGLNEIIVSGGNVDIQISFDVPYKKVGGWL